MKINGSLIIFLFICCFVVPVIAQGPVCGSQMLYFQDNSSTTPAGYNELINYPSGNPQVDANVSIKNDDGPVLIGTYIMPEGSLSSATLLLRGLRVFTTYHYVDGASGVTQINFTAFQRFQNGTEVVFYSQLTNDIDSLTPATYTTYRVSQQDLPLNPTDRLGIKVYGQTTHSSPITLHFLYQGTTNTSHFMSGFFDCPPENPPIYVSSIKQPLSPYVAIIAAIIACLAIAYKKKRN